MALRRESVPPSPRYRVIERGRRLEVIDMRSDAARVTVKPASSPGLKATPDAERSARWPTWPEQQGFDGRALLRTHRWYDARGPRRLMLDPGAVQWIGMARGAGIGAAMILVVLALAAPVVLAVLLLPLALLHQPVRDALRTAATGWLDRFDPA